MIHIIQHKDVPLSKGISGLYMLKRADNSVLYIGKSEDILNRLKHHHHLPQECYDEIDHIDYTIVNNQIDRDVLEIILISQFLPAYNTQLKYRNGSCIFNNIDIVLTWHTDRVTKIKFEHKHVRGGPVGRPKVTVPNDFKELYTRWKNKEITAKEFMTVANLPRTTFYKIIKKYETSLCVNPVPDTD